MADGQNTGYFQKHPLLGERPGAGGWGLIVGRFAYEFAPDGSIQKVEQLSQEVLARMTKSTFGMAAAAARLRRSLKPE